MDNQDLFAYLYDTYMQTLAGDSGPVSEDSFSMADDTAVKKFCEFAREHLSTNTPIHMGFEDTGMGMQLQDGTHLVFVEQRAGDAADAGTVVPVTTSSTANRGMSSIKVADDAVPITEGKERSDSK